ncbi:MAG: phosphopentomutase [Lachnospiraceae bacterium]|nr:phosphopentomutase [Ruminococcus sp.]MCM1274005.1 phosphopentomutase [Lachnospiraceae bacterium]
MKRVFLIVLDSFGVGEMPDAADFGDKGANTLRSCFETGTLNVPNMRKLGLFNIDGVNVGEKAKAPEGAFMRIAEKSKGKDTTTGHWEIAGCVSEKPFPTFPNGFPPEVINKFEEATGRKVLCNKPYSGTKVIADYGKEHVETGALIVYTSADSVFQIAAHEDVVPVETLYEYCGIAREILTGDFAVGRVIARPFEGEHPYTRTPRRHDFSLTPPRDTMLDILSRAGKEVVGIGKIYDIFAGRGVEHFNRVIGNVYDMNETSRVQRRDDLNGLCFTNLVDFDMQYGHRRDPLGYANALNEFDGWLGDFMEKMLPDDVVIITADHGCDPCHSGTDHTREYIPVLVYGKGIKPVNLGTRACFGDIGAAVLELLGVDGKVDGRSFAADIVG